MYEIVIAYDKVITLIWAGSDVSHGLIMLVTHAALGAVDPAMYTHRVPVSCFDHPSWSRILIVTRRVRTAQDPRSGSQFRLFCTISSGRWSRMFCRRALSGRESGGGS